MKKIYKKIIMVFIYVTISIVLLFNLNLYPNITVIAMFAFMFLSTLELIGVFYDIE